MPRRPATVDAPVYEPRGAAKALFTCRAPEILIEGPAGTGKSRAVLEKVHLCLLKYPGARGLLVRKTRASMTESVLVTFEEKVLPENDPVLSAGGSRRMRQSYEYPNGSHLVVGGMDNAGRIMSTEYDIIAVFEATELTEDDFEKLTTRLRNHKMPYQQAIADCNPEAPSHWLNRRAADGRMTRLLSRHADNPSVTPDYLARLDSLTGARRQRLREGVWAAQEGMVYEAWNAAIHIVSADAIRPGMVRWTVASVDWGYTDPGVMQVWGVLGDRRMVCLAEHYHTARNVGDWWTKRAQEFRDQYAPQVFVCDPAQPGHIDAFVKASIPAVPANNDILAGIDRVSERLAGLEGQPGGGPSLLFVRDGLVERDPALVDARQPFQTVDEFENYVWLKPNREQRNANDRPADFSNHGMDAMRYAVMYVDQAARRGPVTTNTNTGRTLASVMGRPAHAYRGRD